MNPRNAASDRIRRERPRHADSSLERGAGHRRAVDTLAPPEDVLERRRRHHLVGARAASQNQDVKGAFGENLFILIALLAVIYGLYRLGLHVLIHS